MTLNSAIRPLLLSLLLCAPAVPAWADSPLPAPEKRLGFAISVARTEGFVFNPILRKVLISKVDRGSLAEAAGIRPGDELLRIDGVDVNGSRASAMQPYLRIAPGQTRILTVRSGDGPVREIRLTKPE